MADTFDDGPLPGEAIDQALYGEPAPRREVAPQPGDTEIGTRLGLALYGPKTDEARQAIETSQGLEEARQRVASQGPTTPLLDLSMRMSPFGQFTATRQYQEAQRQIQAGTAQEEHYTTAARYEQFQRESQQRHQTLGGQVQDAALAAPHMLLEAALGGALLRAGGAAAGRALGMSAAGRTFGALGSTAVAGALEAAPAAARVATPALTWGGSLAATARAAPAHFGWAAASTPLMPSFYLPAAAQNALATNTDWTDFSNLAPAYANGVLQVAILGTMGRAMNNIPGRALSAAGLQRLAGSGAIGVGEQAVADWLSGAVGWQTGYGTIGDLLDPRGKGKVEDSLRHATVQFLTFAAFRGLHEMEARNPVRDRFLEATRDLRRQGLSSRAAGERLMEIENRVWLGQEHNPGLNREMGLDLFRDLPEGPLRRFGESLAETLPENAPQQAQQLPAQGPEPGQEALRSQPSTPIRGIEPGTQQPPFMQPRSPGAEIAPKTAPGAKPGPTAPPPAPEAPTGQPGVPEATQKLNTLFPEAKPTAHPAYPGALEVKSGEHTAYLTPDVERGAIKIDFEGPKGRPTGVSTTGVQEGSIGIARVIRGAANKAKEAGLGIVFETDANRAEAYKAALGRQGFTLEGKPEAIPGSRTRQRYTFAPPEPTPRTPEQAVAEGLPEAPPETLNKLEALHQRFQSGAKLDPEDVFKAAGLNARERHVLVERTAGRTHEEIAQDQAMRKPNGEPYTRQRIKQFEQDALRKFGLDQTVAGSVHGQERIDRALDMLEKGQRVRLNELRADPNEVKQASNLRAKAEERTIHAIDKLVDQWAKEKEAGVMTPEKEAEYVAELRRLSGSSQGRNQGQAAETPAGGGPVAERGAGRKGAVRGEGEPQLPGGPEIPQVGNQGQGGPRSQVGQGARPTEAGGAGPQTGPGNPFAPAGGGEAGGRVLDERFRTDRPTIPTAVRDSIRTLLEKGQGYNLRHMEHVLEEKFGFTKDEIKSTRQEAADLAGPNVPELSKEPVQKLDKGHHAIEAAKTTRGQAEDFIREALAQEFKDAQDKAAQSGASKDAIGEAVRSGQEAGVQHANEQAANRPDQGQGTQGAERIGDAFEGVPGGAGGAGKPPSGGKPAVGGAEPGEPGRNIAIGGDGGVADQVGDFAFGANAPKEPGKPLEQAWNITRQEAEEMAMDGRMKLIGGGSGQKGEGLLARAWASIKRTFQRTKETLGELAGEMAPRTTKLSSAAGESIAHHAAADVYAQRAAAYYVDKILPGATDAQAREFGAAFLEQRFRYARTQLWQRADQARREANGIRDPEQRKAALDKAAELDKASREVRTFIGRENSGMETEADFQRITNSPEFKAMQERWKNEFVPKMEEFYRKAEGLEADDPIHSLTQMPGLPINAKAILASDPKTPGTVLMGGGAGNLKNPQQRKLGFAREFTGSAEGYDIDLRAMIENTLSQSVKLATKAEMYRALEREGLAQWGKQGEREVKLKGEDAKELPGVRPPKGTQEAEPGQISLYLHPDVYPEVRKVLAVDQPFGKIPGTDLLTKVTLMSLVEGAAHSKNLLTFLFKPGVSLVDMAKNFWKVMKGNPEAKQRLLELAEMGAMKPKGMESAATEPSKWNPLKWMGRAIDALDSTMRLTADAAFDRLHKAGRVEGSETNRRNFINQLGQYNKKAQNSLVAFFRDTGIGPFATAGTNYTMQGLRSLTLNPGVKATSLAEAAKLRGEVFLRQAAVLSLVPLVNYLLWKRVDGDDATPFGGIKTGTKDGKTSYFDLAALTGVTRGARTIGLQALLEGTRRGQAAGPIADRAIRGMIGGISHPAEGPIVQFAHIAGTGENLIGQHLAPRVDRTQESQALANIWTALWNANPVVASLSGANQPHSANPPGLEERLWSMLGPYGVKFRKSQEGGGEGQPRMRYVPPHTVPGHMAPTPAEMQRRRTINRLLGQGQRPR